MRTSFYRDNFMYNKIKNLLTDISLAPESINSLFDWLKDLKDRVQPQTTWKPSDEQMDALDSTLQYSQVSHNYYITGINRDDDTCKRPCGRLLLP